ncbi:helix-turn-helix domain-containing protein [Nocardioides sp. TF02-7]|uniref:helix-turn-helix domain-containing protein n=1 Tax=Nocardioides sp. TF02-7 TaxID=2917724 RepID=UPI001F068BE9|nr:helix-turn-helix domain-containing protein [Nocardioides sp. TF02-7]UMG94440.1 MarR family transcriptional regulator [Nocardioides sp. TF02-7]
MPSTPLDLLNVALRARPPTVTELARHAKLTVPQTSALVDDLVAQRLIGRVGEELDYPPFPEARLTERVGAVLDRGARALTEELADAQALLQALPECCAAGRWAAAPCRCGS